MSARYYIFSGVAVHKRSKTPGYFRIPVRLTQLNVVTISLFSRVKFLNLFLGQIFCVFFSKKCYFTTDGCTCHINVSLIIKTKVDGRKMAFIT